MRLPKVTTEGFFIMIRTKFFVDGFNLYHSVLSVQEQTGECFKWLNIESLCRSYMPSLGNQYSLVGITYFSAIQEYLSKEYPDKIIRHKMYIRCLKATGVKVVLGRFKAKSVYCHQCRQYIQKHEEKETDVSIAVKILDAFIKDECDLAIIVTGDTDLTPVIQVARECYPKKEIIFLFPCNRENREMAKLAPKSFSIKSKSYRKHQFPDPFILPDKTKIFKPGNW